MKRNITRLPTAAVSYYALAKCPAGWAVALVTPIEGLKPIKTELYASVDRAAAAAYGKQIAAKMQRPFKEGRR